MKALRRNCNVSYILSRWRNENARIWNNFLRNYCQITIQKVIFQFINSNENLLLNLQLLVTMLLLWFSLSFYRILFQGGGGNETFFSFFFLKNKIYKTNEHCTCISQNLRPCHQHCRDLTAFKISYFFESGFTVIDSLGWKLCKLSRWWYHIVTHRTKK